MVKVVATTAAALALNATTAEVRGLRGGLVTAHGATEMGHFSRECSKGKTCYACQQTGHVASDCPNKEVA